MTFIYFSIQFSFSFIFFAIHFPSQNFLSTRYFHLNFKDNPVNVSVEVCIYRAIVTLRSRNFCRRISTSFLQTIWTTKSRASFFRRKGIENLLATPAKTLVDIIAPKKKKNYSYESFIREAFCVTGKQTFLSSTAERRASRCVLEQRNARAMWNAHFSFRKIVNVHSRVINAHSSLVVGKKNFISLGGHYIVFYLPRLFIAQYDWLFAKENHIYSLTREKLIVFRMERF